MRAFRSHVPSIDARSLAERLAGDEPPLVLDVREPWELEICAIPGSLNVPLAELPSALDRLPADRTIAVLCHHGIRSARAAAWLIGQGFARACNVTGGIDAWARGVDASMRVY